MRVGQDTNTRTMKIVSEIREAPCRVVVVNTSRVMPKSSANAVKAMKRKSGIRAISFGNALAMPSTMRMQLNAVRTSGSFRRKVDTTGRVSCTIIRGWFMQTLKQATHLIVARWDDEI